MKASKNVYCNVSTKENNKNDNQSRVVQVSKNLSIFAVIPHSNRGEY